MNSAEDFVRALHRSHLDNGRMVYYAAKAGSNGAKAVMPATPFIFEYFIYNSIYQHDWNATDESSQLVMHNTNPRQGGLPEWRQQEVFLEYLKKKCSAHPEWIEQAFCPFKLIADLDGDWTGITPDHKFSEQDGQDAFESVRAIQDLLLKGFLEKDIDQIFEHINTFRMFVGQVRNNIFHGAKSLEQIYDTNQHRRIELYYHFIQSLTSLFFLTRKGIEKVSSDEVFHPINIQIGDSSLMVTPMKVLETHVEGYTKQGDSELVAWAYECLGSEHHRDAPKGTLFYPSAGFDIITPVLIGLPFCTDFFFYDECRFDSQKQRKFRRAINLLGETLGLRSKLRAENKERERMEVTFEYAGASRRIISVATDNEGFLKTDLPLRFFFHRGDSTGEGGSNQPWEASWYARWRDMIPADNTCAVLTDGYPHGLDPELSRHLSKHERLRSPQHQQPYYCGVIPTAQ